MLGLLPRGYLSSLLAIVCVVLVWTACAEGETRGDGNAPTVTRDTWDITVTFETSSDGTTRTDEFVFRGAVFDGDEHVTPAQWKICVEGVQEGCAESAAECVFSGELRSFEIRCDDDSNDGEEDTPCRTIAAVEFCAIAGTLTTDQTQCDDDNYTRWDDPVFCTEAFDAAASTLTGGVGREFGPSSYGVTWQLDKREAAAP